MAFLKFLALFALIAVAAAQPTLGGVFPVPGCADGLGNAGNQAGEVGHGIENQVGSGGSGGGFEKQVSGGIGAAVGIGAGLSGVAGGSGDGAGGFQKTIGAGASLGANAALGAAGQGAGGLYP